MKINQLQKSFPGMSISPNARVFEIVLVTILDATMTVTVLVMYGKKVTVRDHLQDNGATLRALGVRGPPGKKKNAAAAETISGNSCSRTTKGVTPRCDSRIKNKVWTVNRADVLKQRLSSP